MIKAIYIAFGVIDFFLLWALKKEGFKKLKWHVAILLIPQLLLAIGYVFQIDIILAFTASVLAILEFYELAIIAFIAGFILPENKDLFQGAFIMSLFVSGHYFFRLDYLYASWELLYRIVAIFIIMTSAHILRYLFVSHK